MGVDQVNGTDIFSYTYPQLTQLDSLSNTFLSNGINLYTNGSYDKAIKEFKRAIAMSPTSSYSVDAANYMAQAYLKLNDTQGAIDAYKRAIQLDSTRDDSHSNLGNIYFYANRFQEAQQEYERAVKLNPSANNRFSLGQAYMCNGRYSDAETQFRRVQSLNPSSPNGYYGLGQNYARQGLYSEAVGAFQKAIDVKSDFYDAYEAMGHAYADLGQMDEANNILDLLKDKAPDLVDNLSSYTLTVDPPKFLYVADGTSFPYFLSPGTPASAINTYLANANASKTFSMVFQFDKEMDVESVQNPLNWTINRATGDGPGQAYNFGMPIPSTEIEIAQFPINVYYDSDTMSATVQFTIQQNASANGTIDPSHIEFTFTGKDLYGVAMDPQKNQFSGFSGIA